MALNSIAVAVGDVPAEATLASIRAIKRVAEIEAMRVAGPDRRLSNFNRGRLWTKDDYEAGAATAEATVFAIPPGLWKVVTFGAEPHVIGFGRQSRGKATLGNYMPTRGGGRLNRRLRQPGSDTGWRMGPVFHPGVRGKGSWTKVQKRSAPIVRRLFADALHEAMSRG